LHEVETLCDRVVAINKGRILFNQPLDSLLEAAKGEGLERHFISLIRRQDEEMAQKGAATA
jgi:ABC-type Na+ transport system ATPase subunit NatA